MRVLPTRSTFSFLMNKAGISFCVTIWSTSVWPIQGNKKGHDRGLGWLCFLKYNCLTFVFEASSGSDRKHGLWELRDPPLVVEVPYSPCTRFESCWTPKHCDLTRVLCSWGIMNVRQLSSGQQGTMDRMWHTYDPCLLHRSTLSHLTWGTAHKVKDRVIENFRPVAGEH